MYNLDIRDYDAIWSKFMNSVFWCNEYDHIAFRDAADRALAEHNGRDRRGTHFIEFETEQDATAFILRFS